MNNLDIECSSSKILNESYDWFEQLDYRDEYNMSIHFHSDIQSDDLYIKVFNNSNYSKATKCCRVKIFKAMYKKCNDNPLDDYILCNDEKKYLMDMLSSPHTNGILIGSKPITFSTWEYIVRYFYSVEKNNTIKNLLKKRINKMPNYMNLPDHI